MNSDQHPFLRQTGESTGSRHAYNQLQFLIGHESALYTVAKDDEYPEVSHNHKMWKTAWPYSSEHVFHVDKRSGKTNISLGDKTEFEFDPVAMDQIGFLYYWIRRPAIYGRRRSKRDRANASNLYEQSMIPCDTSNRREREDMLLAERLYEERVRSSNAFGDDDGEEDGSRRIVYDYAMQAFGDQAGFYGAYLQSRRDAGLDVAAPEGGAASVAGSHHSRMTAGSRRSRRSHRGYEARSSVKSVAGGDDNVSLLQGAGATAGPADAFDQMSMLSQSRGARAGAGAAAAGGVGDSASLMSNQSAVSQATLGGGLRRKKHYAYFGDRWANTAVRVSVQKIHHNTLNARHFDFAALFYESHFGHTKARLLHRMIGGAPLHLSDKVTQVGEVSPKRQWMIERSALQEECFVLGLYPAVYNDPSNAVHTYKLEWSPFRLEVHTSPLHKLVNRSTDRTVVCKVNGQPLGKDDFHFGVVAQHRFILERERGFYHKKNFEQLYKQHIKYEEDIRGDSGPNHEFNARMLHPLTDYQIKVQRKAAIEANEHYNWHGMLGRKAIEWMSLKFNGSDRQQAMPAGFWTDVQMFEHYRGNPDTLEAYNWSFCHDASSDEPCGSFNALSKKTVTFDAHLDANLDPKDLKVTVFGNLWQFIAYRKEGKIALPLWGIQGLVA